MKAAPETGLGFSLRKRPGSLQFRVGFSMMIAILAIAAIFFLLLSSVLERYFGHMQDRLTANRLEHVVSIVNRDAEAKIQLTRLNAEWDETWDFIAGQNGDYLTRTYGPTSNSSGVDVVLVFGADRRLIKAFQPDGKKAAFTVPPGLDISKIATPQFLTEGSCSGLISCTQGVLMLASSPVHHTNLAGSSNGWLVFGAFLDDRWIKEMNSMSGLSAFFSKVGATSDALNGKTTQDGSDTALLGHVAMEFLSASTAKADLEFAPARLTFHSLVPGQPIVMNVQTPLLIYRNIIATKNWILVASFVAGVTVALVGLAAIGWFIIRPLGALDRQMRKMAETPDEPTFLATDRDDEIGRVARSANSLLQSVVASRREVQEREMLLGSILDSATEGIVAFHCLRDDSGQVRDFEYALLNHFAEKILRVESDELVGKSIREVHPKLIKAGVYDRWMRVVELRQPTSYEFAYEGHRIAGWYYHSVGLWGDGLVVTIQDITERKRKEQELANSYAEMDRFNAIMIDREERIIAIKKEVNELRVKLNLPPLYEVVKDE